MGMRPNKAKGPYVGLSGAGGGTPAAPTTVPTWFPCMTFTFADLISLGGVFAGDYEIYSLIAYGTLEGVAIKTNTAFAGPLVTALTVSLGITGNLAKYLSPYDLLAAVSGTNFGFADQLQIENFGAATSIRLAAQITGATFPSLNIGAGCLWIKGAKLTP